jgi:uncharacterized protein YecE (DUF72 family)
MPNTPAAHGLYRPHVLRPLPTADYATYAAAVPDDFRFVVKAHAWYAANPARPSHASWRSHTE